MPNNHWEVEQKFQVPDPTRIRHNLDDLGISWHQEIDQRDRYFNHPSRDFGQTDEALRLRQSGERNYITYKGPKIDVATKTRRELEVPLVAGTAVLDQFAEVLILLGFR